MLPFTCLLFLFSERCDFCPFTDVLRKILRCLTQNLWEFLQKEPPKGFREQPGGQRALCSQVRSFSFLRYLLLETICRWERLVC
jgi:hypothetical protein